MSERDTDRIERIVEQMSRRHVWREGVLPWPYCRRCGIGKHSRRNPICLATPEPKRVEVQS